MEGGCHVIWCSITYNRGNQAKGKLLLTVITFLNLATGLRNCFHKEICVKWYCSEQVHVCLLHLSLLHVVVGR